MCQRWWTHTGTCVPSVIPVDPGIHGRHTHTKMKRATTEGRPPDQVEGRLYASRFATFIVGDGHCAVPQRVTLQTGERQSSYSGAKGQVYVSWMYYVSGCFRALRVFLEYFDGSGHGWPGRRGQLNLDGNESSGSLDYEVHLRSSPGPPKVNLWGYPPMRQRPDDLGQHRCLHDGATHGT